MPRTIAEAAGIGRGLAAITAEAARTVAAPGGTVPASATTIAAFSGIDADRSRITAEDPIIAAPVANND